MTSRRLFNYPTKLFTQFSGTLLKTTTIFLLCCIDNDCLSYLLFIQPVGLPFIWRVIEIVRSCLVSPSPSLYLVLIYIRMCSIVWICCRGEAQIQPPLCQSRYFGSLSSKRQWPTLTFRAVPAFNRRCDNAVSYRSSGWNFHPTRHSFI